MKPNRAIPDERSRNAPTKFAICFELDGLKPSSWTVRMPKSERDVLEVLFPVVRARLLRLFLCSPQEQFYGRELTARTGLAVHTIQDELRKLSTIGLLTSWSNGYHRFYRARRDHPLFSHLRCIVQTAVNLPKAEHSALRRKTGKDAARKRKRSNSPSLPLDRPRYWRLHHSGRSKT